MNPKNTDMQSTSLRSFNVKISCEENSNRKKEYKQTKTKTTNNSKKKKRTKKPQNVKTEI